MGRLLLHRSATRAVPNYSYQRSNPLCVDGLGRAEVSSCVNNLTRAEVFAKRCWWAPPNPARFARCPLPLRLRRLRSAGGVARENNLIGG